MIISKRLLAIAKLVPANKVVFDVGSDHALLPCYLVKNHISTKVYAGDNKEGPLLQAQTNILKYGFEKQIKTVLSDGLDKMSDDVEVVTICGMGYHTVLSILNKASINNLELLIIQINKNVDLLRRYLAKKEWSIIDEEIVFEDGHYYEVLVIKPSIKTKYTEEEILFGPVLLSKKSQLFIEYLNYRLERLKSITKKTKDLNKELIIKQLEKVINAKV